MPYIFMFLATGIMCLTNENLLNVIPGHPIISFLVLAFGAMVLAYLIMLLALIGSAFSMFCCTFILGTAFISIINAIRPDSIQYFILLTVIFSAFALPLCFLSLKAGIGRIRIPWLSCIVAGILNALSAALYIEIIIEAWDSTPMPRNSTTIGKVVLYIVFAVVFIGAFVLTIHFRDELEDLTSD